jgi:hypothetical protein
VSGSAGNDGQQSIHYLTAVAAVTIVVAALGWIRHNQSLAFAAAVLGLYVLHLLSIRMLLNGQRRQREALESQWDILQRIVSLEEAPEAPTLRVPIPTMVDPASYLAEPPVTEPSVTEPPVTEPSPIGAKTSVGPDTAAGDGATAAFGVADAPAASARPSAAGLATVRRTGPPSSNSSDAERGPTVADEPILPATRTVLGGDGGPVETLPRDTDPDSQERPRRTQSEIPIPRHFALGTVALVRDLLTPAEVARVLLEQRKRPDHKFASLAVEMDLLTESEREELLLAQQEGLFTDVEMREARARLKEFRESTARTLSELE